MSKSSVLERSETGGLECNVSEGFKSANCYMNNINLKTANVKLDITKEQFDEYLKCANDPIYFTNTYVKIINIDHGLMPFKTRDYQEDMINAFNEERFSICKMCRQSGKSTTVVAFFLWYILFQPDKAVAICANRQDLAIEILDRLKMAYEYLPWFLQQGVMKWNAKRIELENGSKCIAGATSSNSIRGGSFNIVMLDEFAHIKPNMAEEFFTSVYPVISSGEDSKIIIVSTPNGMNQFYKLWTESEDGLNSYKRLEVHWSQVPGRNEDWKKETIANTSQRQFDQEQECLFLGSANTLINGHKLRALAHRRPIHEQATPHTDDRVLMYKEPEEGHSYVITVDVSEGVGLDASALSVIDVTEIPYVQVAKYASKNIDELLYPDIIHATAVHYNNAMVLVENNTGREVSNTLEIDLGYENIISVSTDKRLGQIAGGGYGGKSQNGVKMSKSVKRIGCTTLKTLIENDKFILNDFETIAELMNFTESKGSYSADGDGHDDHVMTLVLFAWLSTQDFFKEISDLDLRRKLIAERKEEAAKETARFFNATHEHQESFVAGGDLWSTTSQEQADYDRMFDDDYGVF